MKIYIVKVLPAIFVGVASTAYAASTTVTINLKPSVLSHKC